MPSNHGYSSKQPLSDSKESEVYGNSRTAKVLRDQSEMKGEKPGAVADNEPFLEKFFRGRALVAGKKTRIGLEPCTTPILPWFDITSPQDSGNPLLLDLSIVTATHPVSARQLGATLWDVSHYRPRSAMRPHKSFDASLSIRSSSDQVITLGSLRTLQHHRPIQKNPGTQNPESSACYISSLGGAPFDPVLSPSRSINYRPKSLDSGRSMKTSTDIVKALNRIEQNRKTKELEHIDDEVQSLRIELEHERRLRKCSETLLFKLAQDLSDLKFSLLGTFKKMEHYRKSWKMLESLCDEFACGLEDYEQKVHDLKQKCDLDWAFLHAKERNGYDEEISLDNSGSHTLVFGENSKLRQHPYIWQTKFVDKMEGASSMKINHMKGHLINHNNDCNAMSSSSGIAFGANEWMANSRHQASSKVGQNMNYENNLISKLVEVRSKGENQKISCEKF